MPNPAKISQAELLTKIRTARQELLDVLAEVPTEKRALPNTLGDWSVKDTLVHLNFWGGQMVTLLYQLRAGGPLNLPYFDPKLDVDALNRRWFLQSQDRPWELAWADFTGLHQQVLRRVAEFSDSELNNPRLHPKLRLRPLWEWIAADTCDHDAEHMAAIRAWLALP